jgi:sterol desaturase/sphingolipid hydroxylase (fatty acid hydroxylase superfamily)
MIPETPDWAKAPILGVAIFAFIFLMIAEMLISRRRNSGAYEYRDTAASLLMGAGSLVAGAIYGIVHLVIILGAYEHRLFNIGWTWWALIICFFAEDLVYYIGHRLSHERRLWWASHVVHHSSQHFNGSTALRQAWTGIFGIGLWVRLPLFFIGFPPAMVFMFTGITAAYQLWIHTEQVKKIGPFEWIFNTASHHRVHHATNPRYIDSNHGAFLIIWDRMFGTFVAEDESDPCRYGITSNLGTFNPLRIALHEWMAIWQDVRKARSLRDAFWYVFGAPGWTPDGSRETSRTMKEKWAREKWAKDNSACDSEMIVPAE